MTDSAADPQASPKPARKPRRRSTTGKKKATAQGQAPLEFDAPPEPPEVPEAPKASKAPDQPVRKKVKDVAAAASSAPPAAESPAPPAEPPAPAESTGRSRRGRRKSNKRSPQHSAAPAPGNENGNGNGSGGFAGNPAVKAPYNPPAPPPPADLPRATGILEMANKSDGRLRQLTETYVAESDDPVVPSHLLQKYGLRAGLRLEVTLGKPVGGAPQHNGYGGGGGGYGKKNKNKRPRANAIAANARRARDILLVDGIDPEQMGTYKSYEDLTTIMPQPRLTLEYPGCPPACRLIDLFCPIGYGTRGLIVSPPKAGKTTLLHNIATAIARNHPQVEVYALLVDERPEEVTDFRRNVPCTVWASSNDHSVDRHVGLAQLALERAKRHAEMGRDVVVLMDSLTRLGRAFNTAPGMQGTGRTLSGGLDAGALAIPKQLFGGARKFEEGGSLTIIATALVDTGSRGDQVIFEEFKGTGNMELILDRKIAEQRVFPAIDLAASGTRNEELLMSKAELHTVTALRRRLQAMQPVTQIDQLLKALQRFETNAALVGDSESKTKAPV